MISILTNRLYPSFDSKVSLLLNLLLCIVDQALLYCYFILYILILFHCFCCYIVHCGVCWFITSLNELEKLFLILHFTLKSQVLSLRILNEGLAMIFLYCFLCTDLHWWSRAAVMSNINKHSKFTYFLLTQKP